MTSASNRYAASTSWTTACGTNAGGRPSYSPTRVESSLTHFDDAATPDVRVDAVLATTNDGKVNGMVEIVNREGGKTFIRIQDGMIVEP